ncbi:MAG: nucleoside triphosphate pyrophosphohydrolase [Rhodospirillaceae bacterium]
MPTDAPPAHAPQAQRQIDRLLAIMARLRDPVTGCPWDIEQSFRTVAPHTIEESYEVADAIERADLPALRDELGDLLFQVVFHAQIAHEAGAFDFEAVAEAISDKMIRRHPHVFGTLQIADAAAQTVRWEEQKAAERAAGAAAEGRSPSALDGVIRGLPGLTRALKLQKRAARVGFDWTETIDILDKIEEEVGELRVELRAAAGSTVRGPAHDRVADELGDLLFVLVNLARRLEVDPEGAIRGANAKFERRFQRIEALLARQGRAPSDASLEEMEALWQQAKREERGEQS